jgi:hypothetical protein
VKNGEDAVLVIVPEKPPLHVQPSGTFVPAESVGQVTAEHELKKNGEDKVPVIVPEKPPLHVQPSGTLVPVELEGQATPSHCPEPAGENLPAVQVSQLPPLITPCPAGHEWSAHGSSNVTTLFHCKFAQATHLGGFPAT